MNIDVESYFKKYSNLCQFEEGHPEYLLDKDDFKAAVKEIIEAVIDKCAEEANLITINTGIGEWDDIDKDSILSVKTMIKYEHI